MTSNDLAKHYSFTVIITTYDRPDYLRESLKAAINQTHKPLEVLIIDDNSSKDYTSVLSEFPAGSFTYHKFSESSGANVARNFGIANAKGDAIAFLDDDDVWDTDYLAQHNIMLLEADAVLCGYRFLEEPNKKNINPVTRVTPEIIKHGNKFCGMSGVTCKTELAKELMFDIELPNSQDWDFFVRIAQSGALLANIPKDIFNYRRGHLSISTEVVNITIENTKRRLKAFKKHRKFLGEDAYNERVVNQILSYIGQKKNKISWLRFALKEAGVRATVKAIGASLGRKFGLMQKPDRV